MIRSLLFAAWLTAQPTAPADPFEGWAETTAEVQAIDEAALHARRASATARDFSGVVFEDFPHDDAPARSSIAANVASIETEKPTPQELDRWAEIMSPYIERALPHRYGLLVYPINGPPFVVGDERTALAWTADHRRADIRPAPVTREEFDALKSELADLKKKLREAGE